MSIGKTAISRTISWEQDWRLHPLIHTLLHFTLVQDVGVSQRFSGLGNKLPQTGHINLQRASLYFSLHLA